MIRVLIADDNPVIRGGLKGIIGLWDDMTVCGEASTGKDAIAKARACLPHVVLLDVRMPVMDGLDAVASLSANAHVLMLTYSEEQHVVGQAIRAGASGYLVHGRFDTEELASAIRTVHEGGSHISPVVAPALFDLLRHSGEPISDDPQAGALTEREVDVMNLVARGLSNADIAGELFISEKTVKNHINRAYTKLDVTTRAQAIATWLGTAL